MEILVIVSFALFYFLRHELVPSRLTPHSVSIQGSDTAWKWVNTLNSLIHSLLTGIGALICFYLYPENMTDVVMAYSSLSHGLTAFSIGYFIFDFFDILFYHRKSISAMELLLHHIFVLSCFVVALQSQRYFGFVMAALVIEVNSVFLHWRQLLIICQTSKTSFYYKIISMSNLVTLVFFRIITLGWMVTWLANNSHQVSTGVHVLGCVVTITIVVMSIVLSFRLIRADFGRKCS